MLTYDFENVEGPLYDYVYRCIKKDIISGILAPGEKLPSKRSFARNNGISTITIQNAYDQLISEGYVYTVPKTGYYVADIEGMTAVSAKADVSYDIRMPESDGDYIYDLSDNGMNPANFPFSVWARVSRDVIANRERELMQIAPAGGVRLLREAIAEHLQSFRGMLVDPDQIVIGAGTEYLYGVLIQLLGKDRIYAIENPGYNKLVHIYGKHDIACRFAGIDGCGVTVQGLRDSEADVAHISPNHHFPTGITMPASRRYEVLSWANESDGRYIIEDDYDSEFRVGGRPIPTLFSIAGCEKVIYMNTFSKSLSPTIRISYMVLPVHLANRFYETLSFYACTVSNFEQYILAQFMKQGHFEKHINRMRLFYGRKRARVLEIIKNTFTAGMYRIIENDSGLHFILEINTELPDGVIKERLKKRGLKISAVSDYEMLGKDGVEHQFIFNYSNIDADRIEGALRVFREGTEV